MIYSLLTVAQQVLLETMVDFEQTIPPIAPHKFYGRVALGTCAILFTLLAPDTVGLPAVLIAALIHGIMYVQPCICR